MDRFASKRMHNKWKCNKAEHFKEYVHNHHRRQADPEDAGHAALPLREQGHVPGLRLEPEQLRPGRRAAGQGAGQARAGSRDRRRAEGVQRPAGHLIKRRYESPAAV